MKNLLLFSALAFTSGAAWCQLTVKPNGSTDSFIYAENENVIYVKGAIDLTRNSPGDTEASIYLRNGAQLIQGDPNALNSGNGQLSVQQTSPVTNAYAYYYWCSPVGSPTDVGSNIALAPGNTNFGIEALYEDKNDPTGFGTKAIKSDNIADKEGYTLPKLTISRRWITIMEGPGTEKYASYQRINATNGAPAGRGFTMKGVNKGVTGAPNPIGPLFGHKQTYEFRGRPNNGNFTIPVKGPDVTGNTNPPIAAVEAANMMLTGNPYPSALDLNKVFWETNNEKLDAIYFYDEDRTRMSHLYSQKPFGYAVWVPGPQDLSTNGDPVNYPGYSVKASFFIWNANGGHNGDSTGDSQRPLPAQRYAPIGQGFMFVGNATGNVTIKNTHRVFKQEGQYSTFFREGAETSDSEEAFGENGNRPNGHTLSSASGAMIDNRTPQLRLLVTFDDKLSRELLLILSPQTSDAYDRGFDALSPMGMKSEVYFPIETDGEKYPYVIQGTNFEPTKMIPLTIELFQAGKVEVKAIEEIRKPYQKAYLYDQVEDIYRPLVSNRAAGTGFNLPAGFYENRFFIVFQQEESPRPNIVQAQMDIEAKMQMDVKMFQNNPSRQLEIMNPEGYSLKAAYVYDMNGKLVITDTNLGDASNYSFYTGNLSDGMYMVKLITKDEITLSYKAMVINK